MGTHGQDYGVRVQLPSKLPLISWTAVFRADMAAFRAKGYSIDYSAALAGALLASKVAAMSGVAVHPKLPLCSVQPRK